MGLLDRLYDVRCSWCDKALPVPETILGDIFQCLQDSSTDDEQLRLLCPACKRNFRFDYRSRRDVAVGGTPLPLDREVDHAWFSIVGKCDPSNSCPPLLLFAIRPHGTSRTEVEREFPTWSECGLSCMNGHPIVSLSFFLAQNIP
jgi:hypothetical protein